MSRFITKRSTFGPLVAGILVASCLSGCAVSPKAYTDTSTTNRQFSGFTTRPNEEITIEVQRPGGGWDTLTTTRTEAWHTVGYGGIRYYYWRVNKDIPQMYWENLGYLEGEVESAYYHEARVRMLDSNGNLLYSFMRNFSLKDLTPVTTVNPVDVWVEKGNKEDYVPILLKSFEPNPF